MKKKLPIICLIVLLLNTTVTTVTSLEDKTQINPLTLDDFDPLVDITISVDILAIRAFDKIDLLSEPDFFVKIIINDEEFISDICSDTKYLYDCFSVNKNVPDDVELVEITIQLWESNLLIKKICDISEEKNIDDSGYDLTVFYNVKTGHWSGDDYNLGDSSGYGRGNGCGDGSIYKSDRDCEIYFNIYQNDFDNDTLPYYLETYVYGTDPTIDNTGEDNDNDGVPIEWEYKWGFNPLIWEDHQNFDPDSDSINNYEEFLTSELGSDPFRKDLFLEMDYMQESNGEIYELTQEGKEYLKTPFQRRDIIMHIDTGEENGGQVLPYAEEITFEQVRQIWFDYFMNGDENNWRRGVYHYGVFVHRIQNGGFAFSGDVSPYWGYLQGTDSFVASNTLIYNKSKDIFFKDRDYLIASMIMHEMGHNFGIRWGHPFGCDARSTLSPLKIGYWLFRNYKSIMNYRYTYFILDYSDGSHGKRDYDDWENIDLTYFEKV